MVYLIKCGKMYDGLVDTLQHDMEILIEDNKIMEVGKNLSCRKNWEIIDLSDKTVTPGLIDAHLHADFFDLNMPYKERILYSDNWRMMASLRCAQKTLMRGFTTIRSMGSFRSHSQVSVDAKKTIERGYMPGSRMVVAAGLGATASHGDASVCVDNHTEVSDLIEHHTTAIGNGKDFFVQAVRRQKKYGNDFIKIMATGGFASLFDSPVEQQLSEEELRAIIETSHQLGMTVTAHAYSADLIMLLVNMGIDGIEHGSMLDKPTARMMEEKGTYLVPTFCPYDDIICIDEASLAKKTAHFREKLRAYAQLLREGREVIINSKIKLGYGTDFVAVHNNYDSGYEFYSWFINGMDPFRILRAATSANAEIVERNDIGTIEQGKLADISAWSRDLLQDPKALLDCAFVMKDGVIYNTEPSE